MRNYERLRVWQAAHSLSLDVYRATQEFPASEKYGLTSQFRKSAVSIGSNLAEGGGRSTQADLRRFVDIALGSACELEYQLRLSRDLGFIAAELHSDLGSQADHLRRALSRFSDSLRT